jgi:hypothetical protein
LTKLVRDYIHITYVNKGDLMTTSNTVKATLAFSPDNHTYVFIYSGAEAATWGADTIIINGRSIKYTDAKRVTANAPDPQPDCAKDIIVARATWAQVDFPDETVEADNYATMRFM